MSKKWGIEAFISRHPETTDMALARWKVRNPNISREVPLQVQGIPNAYLNTYDSLAFSAEGAWYVTSFYGGAPPGEVYYARYDSGEFNKVATIPVRGGGQFDFISYPHGIVAFEVGNRWVTIVEAHGAVYTQQLPRTPAGDGMNEHAAIRLWMLGLAAGRDNAYQISLAIGPIAEVPGGIDEFPYPSDSAVGATFTQLFTPGQQIELLPALYAVPGNTWDWQRPGSRLACLAAEVLGVKEVMCKTRDRMRAYLSKAGGQCIEYRYLDTEEFVH